MQFDTNEISRRTAAAMAAIRRAAKDGEKDSSVPLFVSHHLQEIEAGYWQQIAGTTQPSLEQVIGLLVLRGHWGYGADSGMVDNGIDVFDFTLPGKATNYVIAVKFDESGTVQSIEMES